MNPEEPDILGDRLCSESVDVLGDLCLIEI